jgi:cytochrome c2
MSPPVRTLQLAGLALLLVGALPGVRAHPIVAGYERFYATATAEAELVAGGVLLLNELNCVACHAAPASWRERLPGRGKISLAGVGERLSADALRRFIASPSTFKPGTVMPRLAAPDPAATDGIVAFLQLLTGVGAPRTFPAGEAARGRRLFESVGCVACHAPVGATRYASVPIALAGHYGRDALAAFLQNPLHTRPAGRMPATELSDAEAADLAAYLQPGNATAPAVATSLPREPAAGRSAFAALNCAACHDVGAPAPVRAALPLARVRPEAGCLAPAPAADLPHFSLSAAQSRALTTALRALQAPTPPPALSAEQRVTAKFEQLNCYACHEWRGRGGVEPARAASFATSEVAAESLGELGRLPPRLDQAGRKLTERWLKKLLWDGGGGVRPYLTARMPRYGEPAVGELVAWLGEACRPATPQEIDTSGAKGHQRSAAGRQLIGTGTGGLGCVACHGLLDREPSGVRAVNLTATAQRLRPEYFKALLLDPQGVQPGTIMPPLFAGRESADKEIESLWTYLRELDQNPRLPEGLAVPDAWELKPETPGRPIIFRTFLVGAGTHAIAVGFPDRVHVAFDAFEVRWALAWRGRFLDATANWEERTMPPVTPLGDSPRSLPLWMPLVRLASAGHPWPAACGESAGFSFQGYRVRGDGVPVFRYRVENLTVEDVIEPVAGGAALRRVLFVRGSGDGWFFRGLGDTPPRLVVWHDGRASFEETLAP